MFHVQPLLQKLWASDLDLYINQHKITSHSTLLYALAKPNPPTTERMLQIAKTSVSRGTVSGIDLSLGYMGLLDHVLFVQGYDKDYLYVLDTLQVPGFPYEKVLDEEQFLMRLPIAALNQRRAPFSRIWEIIPRDTKETKSS